MSALDEEDRRHIQKGSSGPQMEDSEMQAVLAALPEEDRLVL